MPDDAWVFVREREKNAANLISDGGGLFCPCYSIGAMVLLISPEQIKLESCACAQIKLLKRGIGGYT